MMERQVLVTRKLNTETSSIPTDVRSTTTTAAPAEVFFPVQPAASTDNEVLQVTTTTAVPTKAATARSIQVPTESITEMMKVLRKRPTGLFENKLARMREKRMRLLSSARGKPKKPVVLKFTSK